MVQKHIVISMIAPVAVAGILIMATLANQAYSSSGSLTSVKCKITKNGGTKCKTKTKTITPPQGPSNNGAKPTSAAGATTQPSSTTGNGATSQKSSNTATAQVKCTSGYIWYPKPPGGFRHCALGSIVNAPQGSSSTHPLARSSNSGNTAQESSNSGNGATNTATIQLKCTTGYIWLPTGGFRHCALGAMVNAPQGSSNTHPGLKTES
jgi:hypothetical protein